MNKHDVTFNVKGYVDRRTPELKERYSRILYGTGESDDDAIEREWRRRVAAHPIERQRIARERAAGVRGNTSE